MSPEILATRGTCTKGRNRPKGGSVSVPAPMVSSGSPFAPARDTPDQPLEVHDPELKVIVDTRAPQVELNLVRDPAGQVGVEWTAEDRHVDPGSLQFEWYDSASRAWRPFEVTPPTQLSANRLRGTAAVPVPDVQASARVRLRLSDRAGNATLLERQVAATPPTSTPPPTESNSAPRVANRSLPGQPLPGRSPPATAGGDTIGSNPVTTFTPQKTQRPPVIHRDSTGWQPGIQSPIAPPQQQQPADLFAPPKLPDRVIDPSLGYGQYATPPTPIAGMPAQSRPSAHLTNTPRAALSNRRVSRSRRFEIDYDVDIPDANDVHRVEVWYTSDGGRTWQHHGDDQDKISPYVAQVDEDGVYGFRLIVQARAGFATRPPAPGDPADVWILVDATVPRVSITSAKYGSGNQLGQLHVTWDVRDANLIDRPITLLFSDQPQGPWRKVADQLPNTGRYDWIVNDLVPRHVYLRVEAKDEAGNIGIDALRDPIRSDGLRRKVISSTCGPPFDSRWDCLSNGRFLDNPRSRFHAHQLSRSSGSGHNDWP